MGYAQSDWLPYGRYCVRRSSPWRDGAIEILMLRSVKIKNLLLYFRKPPIQSLVRIEKRDIATGGYSGGRRQISDSKRTDGEEVRYKIYYPTEQWLCEFETDDSGTLTLPGPLGYGKLSPL